LNELIIKHANDYYILSRLYYELAFIANKEKKEFFHLLQKSMEMTLKDIQKDRVIEKVGIIAAGYDDLCEECSKLDGKIFSIKEALKQMPIPNRNCTTSIDGGKRGFCRCVYVAHIDV